MPPSRWIESLKFDFKVSKKKQGDRDPVKVTVVEVGKGHTVEESSSTIDSASSSTSPLSSSTSEDSSPKVQLSAPFYPVSLLLQNDEAQVAVASLPENLGVPSVPKDEPPTAIDSQDAYVPQFCRLERKG